MGPHHRFLVPLNCPPQASPGDRCISVCIVVCAICLRPEQHLSGPPLIQLASQGLQEGSFAAPRGTQEETDAAGGDGAADVAQDAEVVLLASLDVQLPQQVLREAARRGCHFKWHKLAVILFH